MKTVLDEPDLGLNQCGIYKEEGQVTSIDRIVVYLNPFTVEEINEGINDQNE